MQCKVCCILYGFSQLLKVIDKRESTLQINSFTGSSDEAISSLVTFTAFPFRIALYERTQSSITSAAHPLHIMQEVPEYSPPVEEPAEIKNSPHVQRARRASINAYHAFFDANEEKMHSGTSGDRRLVRLHAQKAANKCYEDELIIALEQTEAGKQDLKELITAVQSDIVRLFDELSEIAMHAV